MGPVTCVKYRWVPKNSNYKQSIYSSLTPTKQRREGGRVGKVNKEELGLQPKTRPLYTRPAVEAAWL